MNTYVRHWSVYTVAVCLSLLPAASAFGHGEEQGTSSKNLVSVHFVPNPHVPEFASASGTALVDLTTGVIQLRDLRGFPFDTQNNRILSVSVTSTTDPRFKGHGGELNGTSCEQASTHAHGEDDSAAHEEPGNHEASGPWTCHVHSYVVWLAGLEDGVLGHPIPLATIYPRRDGTAADREFSFREGDVSGFGANSILITAEVSFGALPAVVQGHDGTVSTQLVPRGPVVLTATLP
jgi:hypothetical protein